MTVVSPAEIALACESVTGETVSTLTLEAVVIVDARCILIAFVFTIVCSLVRSTNETSNCIQTFASIITLGLFTLVYILTNGKIVELKAFFTITTCSGW